MGIAGLHQVDGRLVHRRPLVTHRTGIVDDDPKCYRDIFVAEGGDLLGLSVFPDLEVALVEAGYEPLVVVHNGRVEHDFFNLLFENEPAALLLNVLSAVLTGRNLHRIARLIRRRSRRHGLLRLLRSALRGRLLRAGRWLRARLWRRSRLVLAGTGGRSALRDHGNGEQTYKEEWGTIPQVHSNQFWHRQ